MDRVNERFWRREARRLARRANLASWVARGAPLVAIACGVAAPLLLVARRQERTDLAGGLIPGVLALLLAFAAWSVRRARLREADGLVWLEARLGLHNRLSAAAAGVGDWPSPDRFAPAWRWRGARVFTPVAFAVLLLAAAGLVPITSAEAPPVGRPEAPLSWRETEEWIKALKETRVAEEASVKPFEERLENMRVQPEKRWYSESGLEAAESLRDELRSEIRSLATDLDAAAGALDGTDGSAGAQGIDHRRLEGATSAIASRTLKVDPNLMQKLRKAAGAGRRLSALEAKSLAQSLREKAGFCRLALRECRPGDPGCFGQGRASRAGRGGVERGPGPAPLTLDAVAGRVEPGKTEGVSNEDLRQAALGDLVATTSGRHEVASRVRAVTDGGGASRGSGGYEVARTPLTPEERRILARYFK